jgi:pyridoxine 5-phosphate synthase
MRLGVNIDHVATVRNARGGPHPDPLRATICALDAGADGITIHLREDRRHIRDADVTTIAALCAQRGAHLNLEMAATDEMVAIACAHRPGAVCLVPERREERTTEGGLDVVAIQRTLGPMVASLRAAGSRVSLFIAADAAQIIAAKTVGADIVELHTGAYAEAVQDGHHDGAARELSALIAGAKQAAGLGLEVHAGHGLTYDNVGPVAAIPEVVELNIGHFLIGEAIFVGLPAAMAEMRQRIDRA